MANWAGNWAPGLEKRFAPALHPGINALPLRNDMAA
jgi:hypothetical protein